MLLIKTPISTMSECPGVYEMESADQAPGRTASVVTAAPSADQARAALADLAGRKISGWECRYAMVARRPREGVWLAQTQWGCCQ